MNTPTPLLARRKAETEPLRISRYRVPSEYVEMRVNPQRITVAFRKVIQRIQTNTRWVFQHWGMEPVQIQYSGVTGYIRSIAAAAYSNRYQLNQSQDLTSDLSGYPATNVSPYETPAYQALMLLRRFYEEPHKSLQGKDLTQISGSDVDENLKRLLLKLDYREGMYLGYLTRMDIREEENSPWLWYYEMEFIARSYQLKMEISKQTLSDLVRALYATTNGYDIIADTELANAWSRGVQVTTGQVARTSYLGI